MKAAPSFPDVCAAILRDGRSVRFAAGGSSMTPAIRNGDVLTVAPRAGDVVRPGDVVLVLVNGRLVAHRMVRREQDGRLVLRGDAATTCDGPIWPGDVLGVVVEVTPRHRVPLVHAVISRAVAIVNRWRTGLSRLRRLAAPKPKRLA